MIDIDEAESSFAQLAGNWKHLAGYAAIGQKLIAEVRRLREDLASNNSYEKRKWDLFLDGLAEQWREMAEMPDGVPDPQLLIAWANGTIQRLREENDEFREALSVRSVPCSDCGKETGTLGRRITYLIGQNEAFRKQIQSGRAK